MRAIHAGRLDGRDDYAEVEIGAPRPAPGELLVRVMAVGIGYVEALVALDRDQVKPPLCLPSRTVAPASASRC